MAAPEQERREEFHIHDVALNYGSDLPEQRGPAGTIADYDCEPFDLSTMAAGDVCEVISRVAVLDGPNGAQREELEVGIALEVTQLQDDPYESTPAQDLHVEVRRWSEVSETRESNPKGWILLRRDGRPQVVFRRADISFALWQFTVGSRYSAVGALSVRECEALQSKEICEIAKNTTLRIEEISQSNVRRGRVSKEESRGSSWQELGWVSLCTRTGDLLLVPRKPEIVDTGYRGSCTENVQKYLLAARNGDHPGVLRMMNAPGTARPNPNVCDTRGRTALMLAASSGNNATVEALLKCTESGLDVHWVDGTLKSALHHAAMRKPDGSSGVEQSVIVTNLLRHNLALEAIDGTGRTALQHAVEAGCREVVEVLLHHRADVNATRLGSLTPLALAQRAKRMDLVRLLKPSGDGGAVKPKPTTANKPSGDEVGVVLSIVNPAAAAPAIVGAIVNPMAADPAVAGAQKSEKDAPEAQQDDGVVKASNQPAEENANKTHHPGEEAKAAVSSPKPTPASDPVKAQGPKPAPSPRIQPTNQNQGDKDNAKDKNILVKGAASAVKVKKSKMEAPEAKGNSGSSSAKKKAASKKAPKGKSKQPAEDKEQ